jgi:drug/metabolite transporter (DMT)-like permease
VSARTRPVTGPAAVALVVMVAWGATPVASRIALRELTPLAVAVMRTAIGGLVALPAVLLRRQAPPPDAAGRRLLLLSALSGFVVFPILYSVGQHRTSAMHGGMILAALPILTGSYAALVERRAPSRRWLAGCAIAFAGEIAIVALRAGGGGTRPTIAGDLLIVASALVVSAGYVAGARLGARGYRSLATTYWGVGLGALIVAPLLVPLGSGGELRVGSAASFGAVLWLALATSIVGYVGWYWALARGGIARIAPIQFLQPFSGLVLAALLLDERLTPGLAAAAACILVGVAVAQRG